MIKQLKTSSKEKIIQSSKDAQYTKQNFFLKDYRYLIRKNNYQKTLRVLV